MDKEQTPPKWMIFTMCAGLAVFLTGLILDDLCVVVTGIYLGVIGAICLTGEKITRDTERFINDAAKHAHNRGE